MYVYMCVCGGEEQNKFKRISVTDEMNVKINKK